MADGVVAGVLRVVQLNAGSLLEPGWEARRTEIAAWLAELAPDVVCLQEIWASSDREPTALEVVAALQDPDAWHHAFGGEPFGPELWPDPSLRFGSAVLSRWPIESSTYHRLPLADGASGFVAGVPWELLHVRTAGLDVFSCHLAAAPIDAPHRRRQVVAVDEIVADARGDADVLPPMPGRRVGMPAILCGDFNAEPDSDELRFLAGWTSLEGRSTYWQDAWRVAGDGSPGWTQDWRTHPLAEGLNVPRKRVDHVWVGDPFLRAGGAGRVLSARVAFDSPRSGIQASDHMGLVVDIAWPDRPASG